MSNLIDQRLDALSHVGFDADLDGLESAVLGQFAARRRNAAIAQRGAQVGLAAAALMLGVILGVGHAAKPRPYGSEVQVLSDDSVAPSVRLGGA